MGDQITSRSIAQTMVEMKDALIPIEELGGSKYGDNKAFVTLSSGTSFLPRVQLFGANSGPAKRGRIPMGSYGLVRQKDQIEDLTASVNVLVLGWRPKALKIDGDDIISAFNPESLLFAEIQEQSGEKDSGCTFGPEFLLWLPTSSPPTFATFYCLNKTMRREAPNLRGLIGRAATLKVTLIETKKYSWHGPVIVPCSTPMDLPDMEEIREQVKRFNNPQEMDIEKVEAGTETRDR